MFKGNNLGSWFILALGIGAASFWSEAEKDKAESPTAKPERPKQLTIKREVALRPKFVKYCLERNSKALKFFLSLLIEKLRVKIF